MVEAQDPEGAIRHFPLTGMDHSGKPAVVLPGKTWYEENFLHDRRSARKRMARRRLNVHAAGRAGWRIPQNAVAASSWSDLSNFTGSFVVEGWVRPLGNVVNTGSTNNILAVAWKGPLLNFLSGVGMTFVIGQSVPIVGQREWFIRAQEQTTGTVRTANGGVPRLGRWTHIAAGYDAANAIIALFVDGILVDTTPMANPPVTSNYPVMQNDFGIVTQPGYAYSEWRVWRKALTAAEVKAAMNDEISPSTDGLAMYWQGSNGDEWGILDRTLHAADLNFMPTYPFRRNGPFGGSMRFVGIDSVGAGSRATLGLTDTTETTINSFQGNLDPAATGIRYGGQIAGRLHAVWDSHATNMRMVEGLVRIEVLNATRQVVITPSDDAPQAITSTATLVPGERFVIGWRRNQTVLQLYINGVLDGASAPQNGVAATPADMQLGGAVSSGGTPVFWDCDQWTFYGTDPGTTVLLNFWQTPIPDRLELGKNGGAILALSTFGVTNGSATVTYAAAAASLVSGFLMVQEEATLRWRAYRVVSVVAGVSFNINVVWPGRTNPAQWGAFGTVLFHTTFADGWDPQSDNDVGLRTDLVKDELALMPGPVLTPAGSVRNSLTRRTTGYVRSKALPCAGMKRYQKEGEIRTTVAIFDRTLYMVDDRWVAADTNPLHVPAGAVGRYSVRVLPGDFWGRAGAGTDVGPPEFGRDDRFGFRADLYPYAIRGKHVLYVSGDRIKADQAQGLRLVLYIEDGYLKAEWEWNNGGALATATWATDKPCIRPFEWVRVEVGLSQNNVAGSLQAARINGTVVASTSAGVPAAGEGAIGTNTATERRLFGCDPAVQDDLILEGFQSFLGLVHQVALAESYPFLVSGVVDGGLFDAQASTTSMLWLEDGRGWTFMDQAVNDLVPVSNLSRLLYPILENLPDSTEKPYSLAMRRGVVYGTNGAGRHIKAEWIGDFDTYPTGWRAGYVGIAPPRHTLVVADGGAGALTSGAYQVAYSYLNTRTGQRSNPSNVAAITVGATRRILASNIQPSADASVDAIEIYMTAADQVGLHKVLQTPNAAQSVTLDFSGDSILSGFPLETTHELPPLAKFMRFDLGRTYWGNLDLDGTSLAGTPGAGAVAISDTLDEESWNPANLAKVDPNYWQPITGFGAQQGVIHVYTQNGIHRLIAGATDITSYALRLATDRVGCWHGSGIVAYMGLELFPSSDGGFALFNGTDVIPVGRETEADWLPRPDIGGLGVRFQPYMAGIYDTRNRTYLWIFRKEGEPRISRAFALGRRIGEDGGGWSTLDFYDISALCETEDVLGREVAFAADSWGYVYALDAAYQDVDHLGVVNEAGSPRVLSGLWSTDPIKGPAFGDGARGYTIAGYNVDADGMLTAVQVNRLLGTPTGSAPNAADLELSPSFSPTVGVTRWLLGPIRQILRLAWQPLTGTETPLDFSYLDFSFAPAAGESLWARWYTADARLRPLGDDWDASLAKEVAIPMDDGLTQGDQLTKDHYGRKLILELDYLGVKQLDLYEIVPRFLPEGSERGPSSS